MKWFALLWIGLALGLAGCDKLITDRPKEKMAAAEQRAKSRDYLGAIALYESALDGTAETAEVHYRLAVIYDEKVRNPTGALHHFQRYLELAPKGTFKQEAEAYVKEAKGTRSIASSSGELIRLKNDNLSLQKQLQDYKQRLATLSVTAAKHAEETKAPLPPGARKHTVQTGETLASISQKYYSTRNRANDIQEANQGQLGGKNVIRPGQVLIIP